MHTNRKLFDLATKNSQRNAAGEFLSSFPSSMKAAFDVAGTIYHPELSELLSPIIHKAVELHKHDELLVDGARALLTSSKEKALASFFSWTSGFPEGEYVLVVGGGNGVSFNGAGSWVSHLPGYVLQLQEAIETFRFASGHGAEQAVISSRNGHHAIILEASSGFLPDEPSEEEVVYEVSSW